MTTFMTEEEHDTRAMLMGRWYDPRDGTYRLESEYTQEIIDNLIDAVTLEPITYDAACARITSDGKSYYPHEWRDDDKSDT